MNRVFNPGCALVLYKPKYIERIMSFLNEELGGVGIHEICCKHDPGLPRGSQIVNVCPGCDNRFGALYEGVTTISLWEIIAASEAFPFPDYKGNAMAIHDACPARTNGKVHDAMRTLLSRMNITVIEPQKNRSHSVCCGDDFYLKLPIERVREKMKERADSMPCEDVCVYCVSCVKAMHIGGRTPRYMLDLLFGEATEPQIYDTAAWHDKLQTYIDAH